RPGLSAVLRAEHLQRRADAGAGAAHRRLRAADLRARRATRAAPAALARLSLPGLFLDLLRLELVDQLRQHAQIVALGRRLGDELQRALVVEQDAARRPQQVAARPAAAMREHWLRTAQQHLLELRHLSAGDRAGGHRLVMVVETALLRLGRGRLMIELSRLLVVGPVVDDRAVPGLGDLGDVGLADLAGDAEHL